MAQDLYGWVPISGFLADLPPFGIDTSGSLFDGMIVTEPEMTVFGWALPGTTIRIGTDSVTATDNWWELTVEAPSTGVVEVVGHLSLQHEDPIAETLPVTYMPALEQTFGFITGMQWSTDGNLMLEVDYAQWLTGEEANIAAREDGVIGPNDTIENDYYIRNQNPRLRLITVDEFAIVRLIDGTDGPLSSVSVPLAEFARIMAEGDDGRWYGAASEYSPFWFVVDGEELIYQIQQQYVP